jgi:aminomethyltransferase
MNQSAADQLKKTPLNGRHHGHGARMVPFAGWEMPVEYSGISQEHMAVRTRAGLFDVSHMGEIEVAGRDALAVLQQVTCNDASRIAVGQAQYSALTTPGGTFVDDILVYRLASDHFMLVVNASNVGKDYRWIAERVPATGDAVAVDSSARYALLALQGPAARDVLQQLTNVDLKAIKRYWFAHGAVAGVRTTIATPSGGG